MSSLPAVEVPALGASCLQVHRFSGCKASSLLALLAAAAVLPATITPAAVTNYVWDSKAPSAAGSSRWVAC